MRTDANVIVRGDALHNDMNERQLIVAVDRLYAEELSTALTIPCQQVILDPTRLDKARYAVSAADVVVCTNLENEWICECKAPNVILATSTGVDRIATEALPKGSIVCNVYGHERSVAEQALLLMLSLERKLIRMNLSLRLGNWTPEVKYVRELRSKTMLVLGLGHIGTEVARMAKAFDMRVIGLTRRPKARSKIQYGIDAIDHLGALSKYLVDSDYLIVAIPATTETIDMVGVKELMIAKKSLYLINVGRALVVNEVALYEALRDKRIAGAGLDVWYKYPPQEGEEGLPCTQPFWDLENVVMTPHKLSYETMQRRWKNIADNIYRYVNGMPLMNIVCRID